MKAELETLVDEMISRGILFEEAVKEFEKQFILNVIKREGNNLSKAASSLGIHRNTLSKRISEYQNGFHPPATRKAARKKRQVAPRRKTKK